MNPSYPSCERLGPPGAVIPVSLLNRLARERLEAAFPLCWVSGEVSNLTRAASGHVYFSLKDDAAQVRCALFRQRAQLLGWRLENGQRIEAQVLVTLYEARGDFQLTVETARRAGVGNLYEQYLRLKDKLEREGLFAAEGKRPLPAFPRRIGIVSSPQAAALRDVLTTLKRRAAHVSVILYPSPVQGQGAAAQIAAALDAAGRRGECDALILCRGGGSLEDLWAFNDEALARAIRACPIPVVAGIGHETDLTLADLAADRRAPTPTAAAELAAPERAALLARLAEARATLRRRAERRLEALSQRLDDLALRLRHPAQALARERRTLEEWRRRLASAWQRAAARNRDDLAHLKHRLLLARPDTGRLARRIDALAPRLHSTGRGRLDAERARLHRLEASLQHLDPHAVLARGYAIVTDNAGSIVRNSRVLEPNAPLDVLFHLGRAEATITALVHADENGATT